MFCCIFFILGGKNTQRRSVIILLSLPPMEGAEKQSQHSHLKAGLEVRQKIQSSSVFLSVCVLLGWCNNIVLHTGICKIIRWYPKIRSIGHSPGSRGSYCNDEDKSEQVPLGSFLRVSLMMAQSHFVHREGRSRPGTS